jgi:sigma-B regulation protein RsbU (phosphoserine phosphatase)
LVVDFADSGQFVTLFYLAVDPIGQVLEWVRAGHEPAIFYDPATNAFLELAGSGMALGVDKHCRYEENRMEGFGRGSIIVMATDGVWEARNERGRMFGRTAVYDVIRQNAAAGAGDIMEVIFGQIKKFRNAAEIEDDVTLVVVKLN